MKQITIYDRNGWRLVSFGNGWAYQLTDTENDISAWFQDDDAIAFEHDTMKDGWLVDNVEDRFCDYSDIMQHH